MFRLLAVIPILGGVLLAGTMPSKSPCPTADDQSAAAVAPGGGAVVKDPGGVTAKVPVASLPASVSASAADASQATAKRANTSPAAKSRKIQMTPQQQGELQEILRIRKMQGDIFQGTMFAGSKAEDDQQFVKALEDVIRSAPAPKAKGLSLRKDAVPMVGAPAANLFQGQAIGPETGTASVAGNDLALTATLRDTAELLDAKANLLERSGGYNDADRLRGLAQRLRHEARRWAP